MGKPLERVRGKAATAVFLLLLVDELAGAGVPAS